MSALRIPADKITSYITKHFDHKIRKNGEEIVINNPLNNDIGFHFNINPSKGVCHDWRGDEWAGPVNPETNKRNCSFIKFIRLYKKCSYAAAVREILGDGADLRDYLKSDNRQTDVRSKSKAEVTLPSGVSALITADDTQALALKKWLKSRGYDDESIAKADLHYLGMDVYWPYYEFDTLVYWQSRSRLNKRFNFPSIEIRDDNGHIVAITEGTKGDFLYGFDEVECASYVIITEAIFDMHTLGAQTVASGGAVLTEKQINKLKIIGPKSGVILSPDNDKAGLKSILSNKELLEPHGFKLFYSLPGDYGLGIKDWNECHTKGNMGHADIRKAHDTAIKPLSMAETVRLHAKISALK
jgi:hypothetical protein